MKKFISRRGEVLSESVKKIEEVMIEDGLASFVQAKEAEGVRQRTITDYYQHMKYFKKFLSEFHPEVKYLHEISSAIVREYIVFMRKEKRAYEGEGKRERLEKGLSVNTINIRLRTLKTMCYFWLREQMIEVNFMDNIKPVKDDEKHEKQGLSDEEIEKILNVFDEREFAQWRDKVLILLLLDTGLRINEAVTLKIHQIDFKNHFLVVESQTAKNRKERDVPISRIVAKRIRELYEETRTYFNVPDGYIFYNAYGEPYTADAFRKRLSRLKKKIDIQTLHPHMFRHTFCRKYILNGGDIFTLQKIVDHADIKTSRQYIQMDVKHIKSQHHKYSPLNNIIK